jgi:branched-chain amino acid transport system substrate-binding protein
MLLVGCTDVRPTVKIGVLAPFEGLHRRSGYTALEAVRAAIVDYPYPAAGVIPLALDHGPTPSTALRSAQKLLADPLVAAVVGPLTPALGDAVDPALVAAPVAWYTPYSIAGPHWATGLAAAAGDLARAAGAQVLVLGGWTQGWPALTADQWQAAAGMRVRLENDPANVAAGEAVFWLGSPEEGAAWLAAVRRRDQLAPFVLGPQGEDPVFAERVLGGGGTLQSVYWTIWTDADYTTWTASHSVSSPNAYLVYRAALAALDSATTHTLDAPPSSWVVQVFRYDDEGAWFPAN